MSPEELINIFDGLIERYGISLRINESFPEVQEAVSLDVEHDEAGTFVGCGLYVGSTNTCYYYSDLLLLSNIDFSTISLICHNGVSDLDVLRSWGIDITDEQLYWDTMLIGHILDSSEQSYGLKPMAERKLNFVYPSYDAICGKKTLKQVKERKTLDRQPVSLVSAYNTCDCKATWDLYELQKKAIH